MNRLNKTSAPKGSRYVLMQTPMGVFQFVVPVTSGPDPVEVAMGMFQKAVNAGEPDPLNATLARLKQMAEQGSNQPLLTGLMILKQMADNGLVPPVASLIEGTGITQTDLTQAIDALPQKPAEHDDLFSRMDNVNLN
jgi:hypothetical protein